MALPPGRKPAPIGRWNPCREIALSNNRVFLFYGTAITGRLPAQHAGRKIQLVDNAPRDHNIRGYRNNRRRSIQSPAKAMKPATKTQRSVIGMPDERNARCSKCFAGKRAIERRNSPRRRRVVGSPGNVVAEVLMGDFRQLLTARGGILTCDARATEPPGGNADGALNRVDRQVAERIGA